MVETVRDDGSDGPSAPRVFLSYASEDHFWVRAFTAAAHTALGTVRVEDYLAGDNLAFGNLEPWLDQRIGRAAVVIAFVSKIYRSKKWTIVEWLRTLDAKRLGKLIFVPVMMDSDAKVWWGELRRNGGLSVLPDDYQYADFTDHLGKCLDIDPERTAVLLRIRDLAMEIRGMLAHRDESGIVRGPADVVVLGHPTAYNDDELKAQSAVLLKELTAATLRAEVFGDRWRGRTEAVPPLSKEAIFVQPLAALEAADYVAAPGIASSNLERIGIGNARVALWLPGRFHDTAFESKVSASPPGGAATFRNDTPDGLAAWLRGLLRLQETALRDALALQIEDVGYPDEAEPDPEAVRLAAEIHDGLCGVVNGIVKPNPSPWPFVGFDPGLKELITIVQGDRAIVAVHDLDIAPSTELQTRKAIERKFQAMQDVVQSVESATQRPLNLFRAALVVRNPKVLPFFRYPHDGRYKDWRLLRFDRPDDDTPLKPDPASKAYFRAQLAAWASPRKASSPVH